MIKQLIILLILSIAVVAGHAYLHHGLQLLLDAHHWVSGALGTIFSGGAAGNLIRNLTALISVPLLGAMIPNLIYWFAKGRWFPYFSHCVWVIWLVQTSALVIVYKTTL